jgi:hypothetical protein
MGGGNWGDRMGELQFPITMFTWNTKIVFEYQVTTLNIQYLTLCAIQNNLNHGNLIIY